MELFLENNDQIIQRKQSWNCFLRTILKLFKENNHEIISRE